MSADRMADCMQKLQAIVGLSAAVESWQTGFNSLIAQHVKFLLGPTDVQPVAICLICCRVVQSRDVRSHDLHQCGLISKCQYGFLSKQVLTYWTLSTIGLLL